MKVNKCLENLKDLKNIKRKMMQHFMLGREFLAPCNVLCHLPHLGFVTTPIMVSTFSRLAQF